MKTTFDINEELKRDFVTSSRGAAMGRKDWRPDGVEPYKFHLQRVRFVDGDYDLGGCYWGGGRRTPPLYCAWDVHNQVRLFIRATSQVSPRESVKAALLAMYPNVKFYR